jgi:hypothetical protein
MSIRCVGSPTFSRVDRAGGPGATIALGNNTLAAWVKFADVVTYSEVLYIADSLNSSQYASAIILDPGFGIGALQRSTAGFEIGVFVAPPSAGVWTHVALTYAAGGTCTFYINGVSVGTSSNALGSRGNWGNLQVGTGNEDIQDAVFYNAVLTQVEIQQLMAARFPVRRNNLVVHLPLFPGTNRTIDYSGNGNNFTNQASPSDGDPVPRGWGVASPQVVLPASGITHNISAAGSTETAGSAALTASAGLATGGVTRTDGAAALTASAGLAVAGLTRTTGGAAVSASASASSSGLTQTTGAAAITASASLTAAGLTQTNGSAAINPTWPLAASGLTQTTGAVSVGQGVASGGLTRTTGTATLVASAALAASGLTRSNGAAVFASGGGGAGSQNTSSRRGALVYRTRRRIR